MPDGARMEGRLTALMAQVRDGYALPRGFYTDPDIYEHDIRAYWNRTWIWVGHVSQLREPGDFFRFDYGPESVLVARDREGAIGAFLNVCPHRGSRVCTEASGNRRVFSCPYHAWTFEMNGALRVARQMGEGFDASAHGLRRLHLRVFEGMIFVSTADTPPDLETGLAALQPHVAPFRMAEMQVAHEASYPVPANWKLAVENYMECYHCAPSHVEYSRSHSLKDPEEMRAGLMEDMWAQSEAAGLMRDFRVEINGCDGRPVPLDFYGARYPLFDGFATGSRTGEAVAPLLGDLTAPVNAATDMQVGLINNFLIYGDHVVGYRFIPRGLQETDIQVVWYVREGAREGADYDRDTLTWLWHVTSLDDERIIRVNQEGVNSHHFVPGPLSEMEWGIRAFYAGYLSQIGAV